MTIAALAPAQPETTVRDYHQGLAQHLLDLIRKTTSAALDATPRKSSITPPAPANPRQHSGSSLETDSRISSGVTTADSHRRPSDSEAEESSHVHSPETGIDGTGNSAEEAEAYQAQHSGGSLSDRHDLTARPEQHPSRFPVLSPSLNMAPDVNATVAQIAESSTTAARRYAAQSPTSLTSASSSKDSSSQRRPRPRHITVPSSQTELLTREAEHRKAWETTGRRVWRNIPKDFELNLEKKPRTGSNESHSRAAMSIKTDISGAGPGTAIRADDVFVADVDTRESERLSSSHPTSNRESPSEVSKLDGNATGPSESSVSMSIAKPTVKRTSTLQRRQARLEAEADAQAKVEPRAVLLTESTLVAGVAGIEPYEVDDKASDSNPAGSEDEQEEYIRKRELRLRKKEMVLKKRVGLWWQGVSESGLHDRYVAEAPEIEQHIPSPSKELDSSMLRFPPLPTSMPDIFDSDSPTLRLPSLQLLEDGRRNRASSSLAFDALAVRGESDVDLLIRLTEMSRVSSASGSGRARFPSAPPHSKTHILGQGSGIVTGPSVSQAHNFRVKDTMPTPRSNPNTQPVFSGLSTFDIDRLTPI